MKPHGQNKTSAVMAQRKEPHDSLDDFPTPPWAARALCEHVLKEFGICSDHCWEPAANRRHLVKGLTGYFASVSESDIFQYGGLFLHDFLFPKPEFIADPDWVVTNPPFKLALQFILQALKLSKRGCAMLVRTQLLEGTDRYKKLFRDTPPTIVAIFTERVPIKKGEVIEWHMVLNKKTGLYEKKRFTSATSYCWLVWIHGEAPRPVFWIPPCRKQLERPGDYDKP